MKSGFVIAMGLATLSSVQAKEHYVVKEDPTTKAHKRPKVEVTEIERCVYDTASFRLCAQYGAEVKIGWEW